MLHRKNKIHFTWYTFLKGWNTFYVFDVTAAANKTKIHSFMLISGIIILAPLLTHGILL